MVSVMPDAATVVRTSFTSVLKLFFLEGKSIGVCSLEISIKSLGSSPVRELCSADRLR